MKLTTERTKKSVQQPAGRSATALHVDAARPPRSLHKLASKAGASNIAHDRVRTKNRGGQVLVMSVKQ